MSDLISREAALAAIPSSVFHVIRDLPAVVPQVVCNITGGLLQGASADYPVDVYALDFDVRDEGPEELIMVPGDNVEARLGQEGALVDPGWVKAVVASPTLDVAVACSNWAWWGEIDDLKPIQDLHQRVAPGETMPAGECPECGCLAHLIREPQDD